MTALLRSLTLVTVAALAAPVLAEEKRGAGRPADATHPVLNVWPGTVPGETAGPGPEKQLEPKPGEKRIIKLTDVSIPTITVFRPAKEKDTGTAVLICPGGGYHILAWDLEGTEVAEWLNSIGVTGIVLKYRVPRRPSDKDRPPVGPLQDAQRALSLVRAKAKDLGINPNRLGILGFSAGGHLSAETSTNFDKRAYEPVDDAENQSCRPDFTILIYPAYLLAKDEKGREKTELAPEIRVSKTAPPTFFAHAADDPIKPENSLRMFLALREVGVPGELHVFDSGGHGFGLRPSSHPCSTWPKRCEEWLRGLGLLTPGTAG